METAVWLAKMGKQVSVVEFTGQIMGGRTVTPISDIEMVELYIEKYHIDLRLHTKAVEITPDHVVVEGVEDGGVVHTHGLEQNRGRHLAATVDADIEDVLMVEVEVEP